MKAISVSVNRLLLAVVLLLACFCLLLTSSHEAHGQTCPDAGEAPTPTDVPVAAVPVVVESTTADYFVLYASHEVDGETVWYPVKVALGGEGTTTLAENVAALPVERYRVEKYSVADPADVDGDCTDDITELNNLGTMSPVNSAVTVDSGHAALAIPDRETFEDLAHPVPGDAWYLKIVIADMDTDRPGVYFLDASELPWHSDLLDEIDVSLPDIISGLIVYDPDLVAPNGSSGVFRYRIYAPYFSFNHLDQLYHPFSFFDRIHTLLAANIPLLEDNLALWISNQALTDTQADLPLYRASRMNLLLDEDVNSDTTFQSLNPGEGYGLLRNLDPDERPHSRDVVIYETLPNELPRVAGIISTVPQTPLSHVNLRALQDRVPNAFIRDALEDDDINGLIGSHVHYAVTDTGYSIRAATQAEVDQHFASSRPTQEQTPERDLSVDSITPLSEIEFDDWDSFGVKAANVAVLGTLGFPEGTVPDGFAVPFYFYDEFMKHNGLYDDVEEMLADPDFQSDYDTKVDELKKLRKKIKKAETPEWIETALTAMHATFPEGTSLRYRSSTNNEDLPGFNGAGLYDSKTQHPEETEEDGISKSLKQVYASLWNFRAFIERDFHRVDHMEAAMGVLVHPNYSDELVNGVAVSTDPAYGTEGTHYVNSQVGEDLVTNPEAHSVPEEMLLYPDDTRRVIALSNQVPQGQLLMTGDQLGQLRRHLVTIHEKFAELYGVEDGEQFAMEIEFKITSDNVLAIKQTRPWVFAAPPPAVDNAHTGNTGIGLMASFDAAPTTHDGSPFTFRILFSEIPAVRYASFRDNAVIMSGGSVTRARRVDGREDLWEFVVSPDSLGDVTIVLPNNIPCTIPGAICSIGGRRLSTRLEHTVESLLPRVPDGSTWRGLSPDSVSLGWNDAARADSYEVQLLHHGQWATLPADRIDIAFDGASAVVRALPVADAHSFRLRAVNSKGVSAWSDPLFIPIRVDLDSELTAGRNDQVFPMQSGYDSLASLDGTLSPDSFEIDGTTYRIRNIVRSSESLWLGMYRELPADFSLFVGDSVYLGSESLVPPTWEGEGYWWPSAPPDLSVDSPVRVGLILHPAIPLGERRKAPVTGYFRNHADEHDGYTDLSFRIHFSEGVTNAAHALRDHVLSVTGGTVSGVERVGDEGKIWAVSVTPEGHHPVTVVIEAGLDCQLSSAVCTADGRPLYNRMELTVEPREKNPPTGSPTISGALEVGETLTADTSGIADADGLTGATFSYQWASYDGRTYSDIQGATEAAYTLVQSDAGMPFRVRVSFTDDAGNKQSLTSELFGADRPYGLNASESGGGVVLTWGLPAGWPSSSLFQILRNRPELGETEPLVHARYLQAPANTYIDTDVEPGVLYVYRVKGVDPFGYAGEASHPFEIRTGGPETVENSPATGSPAITGTAHVSETLAADTSGIADPDGLSSATFVYQWLSDDADISGATGSTYTLSDDDLGRTISVRVSFTDDAGNDESMTSEATAPVEVRPNSPATGAPTISGPAHVGETLTTDTSGITDPDGLANATFGYQWLADGADISGATGSSYTLSDDDLGRTITVRVSFNDDAGNDESMTSAVTETVTHLLWSSTLTVGSAGSQSGYSLARGTGVLAPGEFSLGVADFIVRQVLTGSEGALSLGLDRELSGPFTLHVGTVSFAFDDAQRTVAEGGYTYRWDDTGLDWTTGESVGLRLTSPERPLTAVSEAAPASHDGQNGFTFELRFSEELSLSYKTLRDHAFTVTGGTVTKARRVAPPGNVQWEITVSPDSNGEVVITLPATTGCADDGAICTSDDRMLSNSSAITVPGPS